MMSSTGKANGLDMMFEKPGNQNYFPIGFHMSMAYYGSAVNGVANNNATPTTNPNNANYSGSSPSSFSGTNSNNGGWANGAASNTIWDIESL